jgi:hypothetical protein
VWHFSAGIEMDFALVGSALLAAGLGSLAILIAASLVGALRKGEAHAGLVSGLLAFVAAVATLGPLLIDAFVTRIALSPLLPGFATGLVAVVLGSGVFLLERRRQAFQPERSLGLLVIGLGAFLVTMVLFVPALPAQLWPPPQAGSGRAPTPAISPNALASATLEPSSTRTPPPSPTVPPAPTLQPTSTPTRERYSTRTPRPTPVLAEICSALVDLNLNMRSAPSLDSQVLLVIPYSTIVSVAGQSEDATWWFVEYNDLWGWVNADYVTAEQGCLVAPILAN